MCAHRYKALLCLRDLPPADGENCVVMLHNLGPIKKGSYQLGVSKVSWLLNECQMSNKSHIEIKTVGFGFVCIFSLSLCVC